MAKDNERLGDIMQNPDSAAKQAADKKKFTTIPREPLPQDEPMTAGDRKPQQVTLGGTTPVIEDGEEVVEEKIDVAAEMQRDALKKIDEAQGSRDGDMASLFDEALGEEEARAASADEIQTPEDLQEKLDQAGEFDTENGEIPAGRIQSPGVEIRSDLKKRARREFNPAEEGIGDLESSELIPGYDDTDEEEEKTPTADDGEPDPSDEDAYSRYIRDLEITGLGETTETVVKTVKARPVDTVPSGRTRGKEGGFLGDQAFNNAISRFKKDNFSTVSVPLVNSGFIVDMVGTGVVDLIQLYTNLREDTTAFDYDMEKMRVVMKNVVGTHPRINPTTLRSVIHYRDYLIMAWAHICATLDQVETLTNCTDCGQPFRIKCSPRDMLMNMEEIKAKGDEIEASDSIEAHSLLVSNRQYTSENGFLVTIGHPTYGEYVKMMQEIKEYSARLQNTPMDQKRFVDAREVLYYIRAIAMPDGTRSSNTYQAWQALGLLTDNDYNNVVDIINDMKKDIIEPKFGVPSVRCPHCGKEMTDIAYESLSDLVFYHSLISQMVLRAQKKSGT